MEFHLPFFALRKAPPPGGSPGKVGGKRPREPKDISFLKENNDEGAEQDIYRLYPAQTSCLVQGSDEWQWVAYAFLDTEHDEEDNSDDRTADRDDWPEVTFAKSIIEGLIACGHHAEQTIWQPRQYFLKTFEIRIKGVWQEWDQLIYQLVANTRAYVYIHLLNVALAPDESCFECLDLRLE